jgi:hypothetical protein
VSPFIQALNASGTGSITLAITSGDCLWVAEASTVSADGPNDTDGQTYYLVQYNNLNGNGVYEGLYVSGTVGSSTIDTITAGAAGDTMIAIEVVPGECGSGNFGIGVPSNSNSDPYENYPSGGITLMLATDSALTNFCPTSGAGFQVSCDTTGLFGLNMSLWAQNYTGGVTYEYSMNASGTGNIDYTFIWAQIGTGLSVPQAPTHLALVSKTTTTIDFNWTNPFGGAGIINNTVAWGAGASCPIGFPTFHSLGMAGSSYTITTLSPSTLYTMQVYAWNSSGESPFSACLAVMTSSAPTVPGAPTGLTASTTSVSAINLAWTNPATVGLLYDNVSEWNSTSCAGPPKGTSYLTASHSSTPWNGLTPQTPYSFEVAVNNSTGWSQHTACVTNWTTPLAPTGLMNTTLSFTSIDLSWTNPGSGVGLVNDTVYWEVGSSCSGTNSANSTTGAASSYFLMDLPAGTTLAISVTAWDQGGQSAQSNCLVLMTYSYPPPTASSMDIFPLICLAIIAAIIVSAVNKRKKEGQWWG